MDSVQKIKTNKANQLNVKVARNNLALKKSAKCKHYVCNKTE